MVQEYTFITKLSKNDRHLYPHQFHIPTEIVNKLKQSKISRLHISINDNPAFNGSLISNGEQQYFVKVNKAQIQKMGLKIGGSVELTLSEDQSKYGLPLPQEFSAIWDMDQEAYDYFHQLTPGKQRSLIYIINSIKSLDIRMRKATIIMDHLKINYGKLDFKVLHQSFKVNN